MKDTNFTPILLEMTASNTQSSKTHATTGYRMNRTFALAGTTTRAAASFLLTTISLILLISHGSAIPVQHHLPKGSSECLYASLSHEEYITTSLFITSGESLRATTKLQGPIAQQTISSSAEVLAAAMRLDKLGKDKHALALNQVDDIDFENLFNDDEILHDDDWKDDDEHHDIEELDDVILQDYYYMDDDDEYEFMIDDAMDDAEVLEIRKAKAERDAMTPEQKAQREEEKKEARLKKLETLKNEMKVRAEKKKEERIQKKRQALSEKKKELQEMNEGKPVEKTYQVDEEGWYRFCVEATYAPIEVEFDFRTSGELGGPNQKTGHIQTYERHDMLMNEKKLMARLEKNSKLVEGIVKEEDLKTTRDQIAKMNRLLNEIREKQVNERHRLSVHKAVNEHSHSRMVVGSLFETVCYIVISGFQVYTIRRWFSGNPILAY